MAITKALTAPLFAVVGATGTQGGSIIRALQASSTQYRVRAITRDASKPAAQKLELLGCDVCETDVSTLEGAVKAFQGADIGFAITLSDYSVGGEEKEIKLGRIQIDAAKAAGVKTLAWSGITGHGLVSGGKYPVQIFDSKAKVAAYARSLDNGPKFFDIQPGSYINTYLFISGPRKQEDGTFVLPLALDADTKIPLHDAERDYGKYVVGAIEKGGPETVYAAPAYVTPIEMAEEFAKASGMSVTFRRLPNEVVVKVVAQARGEDVARCMDEMFKGFVNVGYYAGGDLSESNKILAEPAHTFSEMLEARKEVIAKLFA